MTHIFRNTELYEPFTDLILGVYDAAYKVAYYSMEPSVYGAIHSAVYISISQAIAPHLNVNYDT
jgi:hypothetical protein